MKKINIFKTCLIAVTFFNCLFFSMEDAFSITQKTVVGPRDRVRKFDDLIFTYEAPNPNNSNLDRSGFTCKPGGLKYMEFNEKDLKEGIDNINFAVPYYVVANLLFFPLLCSQLLNIFGLVVGENSGGLKTFIVLLIGVFGFKSLEYFESLILDEDDFNMDPYNSYCSAVSLSILVICLAITIITKIKGIKTLYKVLSVIALDAAANAVKELFKHFQFSIADAVFHGFELCGDNWLTYGDETIESNLNGRSVPEKPENSMWENWNKYMSEAYPTRGAFRGSYKYKINKCFIENDINYCRVLYGDKSLSSESLAEKISLLYKPYREFYYDGVEFAYNGCTDPRPDRKKILDADDKTSQLYYFRGNDSANFACDRFLVSADEEYREAYKCCSEASQKLICINNNVENKHVMCDKDGKECKMEYNLSAFKPADYDSSKYEEQKKDNSNTCGELEEKRDKDCKEDKNSAECDSSKTIYNEVCDENGNIKSSITSSLTENSDDSTTSDANKTIKFKIRRSATDSKGNKYCVETYNLCPYNFRLLGGTEQYGKEFSMINDNGFEVEEESGIYVQKNANNHYKEFNEKNHCSFDKDGNRHCDGPCLIGDRIYACYNKPSNFCQIDRHCVYVQPLVETKNSNLSPYIDRACIDGIGSSHNFSGYERPLAKTTKNQKVMVAPLVECTVETFKNILLNKAGHTICRNMDDEVIGDICLNSDVVIKQGDDLGKSDYESPFLTVRNYLINIVKAILALSVMLYGYNIILFRKGATPEEILKYVLTLMLVAYFSLSNNWIDSVFNSVYSIYNKVSEFAVDILADDKEKYNYDNPKYSGCFFFDGLYVDNKYDTYRDRKYLAVFDTFDCKVSRYFGYYSNNITNPPIISMFLMGIFSAGLSILTMLPFILLFVSILFFVVRVAYVFIVNSLTITILLFMTPIFIPMILFERTKGFFQSWLKKILQNVMSPLFTFMALSLFFIIFDKYFIADAIFYGKNEPIRSVYCDTICKISESNYFHIDPDSTDQKQLCNESKGKIINLKRRAPICAVQDHGVSNKTGIGLIDFIIEDFPGLPGLPTFSDIKDQIEGFFYMFFDLIFLLILIFIFEQFVSYVTAMTGSIFSSDGTNPANGIDDGASGLPSLQNVNHVVATSGAKMSNKSKDVLRHTPPILRDEAIKTYNKAKNWWNKLKKKDK